MTGLTAEVAGFGLVVVGKDVFTQHFEVGLVGGEREHDEIGVEAVDDVFGVGIVFGMRALTTDVFHDLVLSFTGYAGIRDDDLNILPARVGVDLLSYPVA